MKIICVSIEECPMCPRLIAVCITLLFATIGCQPKNASQSVVAPSPIELKAPSGRYRHDPTHASLQFGVIHLGLSNYVGGFTDYSIDLALDSANLSASTVSVSIEPRSIRTDYRGDYLATHADSGFANWEEQLAMSDKFFNAAVYPEIRFQSSSIIEQPSGELEIVGDLTLLGQTHPVTLNARVVGSTEEHPFAKTGALGLSISGSFMRSAFGMDYLIGPGFVGDRVTLMFEGEMLQAP
jgi:polyisoprenoid-binding protein YceI